MILIIIGAIFHGIFLVEVANIDPPLVSIYFPDDLADQDFQNSTLAIISNSYPAFDLRCNASYPIEWVTHYDEDDDGASEQKKLAETYRHADEFENPNTYTYSANLSIEYTGKLQVFTNFSCKSISNPELQTHVITTTRNRKSVMYLKITSDKKYDLKTAPKPFAGCHATASVSGLENKASCWRCERTSDRSKLELDFIGCDSAIQCNSIYQRQKQSKNCLKIVADRNTTWESCSQIGSKDYNPKTVVCKDYGPVLVQSYYFGVPQSDGKPPKIYFDWSEMDPQQMIYIHPIEGELYKGQNVTLTCEMSKYYFSKGSWFGVQAGGNITYVQTEDEEPTESVWRGSFQSYLNLSLLVSKTVYCFAPVWNSTEWINASVDLNVKIGEAPHILTLKMDSDDEIVEGEQNRYLQCDFSGQPLPIVTWESPNGSYFQVNTDDKIYTSKLTFPEITSTTSGKYICKIQSFLGIDSKSFFVTTSAKHDSRGLKPMLFIGGLILVILLVVGILVVVRLWRIIKAQREALRLLTEAEIKEFIEGNPEFVSNNEYFNSNLVIDALPYNNKFEILPENLEIDYEKLLGKGAFGKVYKGHIQQQELHYQNIKQVEELEVKQDILDVAIKTCDPNVDVMYFKALLSEIKVMAHLGHHRNIVSLVGACTQKIRNRQVFIAVEFCTKGSLDLYLKKHRDTFVNKVQYGILVEDYEEKTGEGNGYTRPWHFGEVSTIHLLKWTLDIANGMEYLHDRKVIHGDLATRNVLLTENNVAKIGDFGLARQLVECSNYVKKTQCPLPWRHLSPESLRDLEFSLKSDVWAFGITLWEIFTLSEVPYPGIVWSTEFLLNLEHGVRLTKPIFATNDIYEFMLKCWQIKPENRPEFSEVRDLCLRSLNAKLESGGEQNRKLCAIPQANYMEVLEGPVVLLNN